VKSKTLFHTPSSEAVSCALPPPSFGDIDTDNTSRRSFVPEETAKADTAKKRAVAIARAQREIAVVRGQMDSEGDYDRLKAEYPTFMLFNVCNQDSDLKSLLLGIKSHDQKKALHLAKQVAAFYNGIQPNTIQKTWNRRNPDKRSRQHADTPRSAKGDYRL
jgi:hypothetical protein